MDIYSFFEYVKGPNYYYCLLQTEVKDNVMTKWGSVQKQYIKFGAEWKKFYVEESPG